MISKNLLGTLILLLNAGGLGFLLYLGSLALLDRFFPKQAEPEDAPAAVKKDLTDTDIMPDEDDLLKDLDLSDLDKFDLEDFE
ncbi:MAG TPA: hypothetical protein VJ943_00875 [Desulfotignum sp.]|nr:hypothetical protein [Desulfotignum sp.]